MEELRLFQKHLAMATGMHSISYRFDESWMESLWKKWRKYDGKSEESAETARLELFEFALGKLLPESDDISSKIDRSRFDALATTVKKNRIRNALKQLVPKKERSRLSKMNLDQLALEARKLAAKDEGRRTEKWRNIEWMYHQQPQSLSPRHLATAAVESIYGAGPVPILVLREELDTMLEKLLGQSRGKDTRSRVESWFRGEKVEEIDEIAQNDRVDGQYVPMSRARLAGRMLRLLLVLNWKKGSLGELATKDWCHWDDLAELIVGRARRGKKDGKKEILSRNLAANADLAAIFEEMEGLEPGSPGHSQRVGCFDEVSTRFPWTRDWRPWMRKASSQKTTRTSSPKTTRHGLATS